MCIRDSSQTERVLVNDDGVIEANEQGVAEWYVRGDLPGEHKIKVNVDGEYFPQPSEYFEIEFPYSSCLLYTSRLVLGYKNPALY